MDDAQFRIALHAALVGDRHAEDEITDLGISRLLPKIKWWIRSVKYEQDLVGDLADLVMCTVWRRLRSEQPPVFSSIGEFVAYCKLVLRSTVLSLMRKDEARQSAENEFATTHSTIVRRSGSDEDDSDYEAPTLGGAASVDSERDTILQWIVLKVLERIPRDQANLISSHFADGTSVREIAKRAGVSTATIYGRLRSALESCREAAKPLWRGALVQEYPGPMGDFLRGLEAGFARIEVTRKKRKN